MKFFKKICVFVLIAVLCCSSIVLSYKKANSCEAAATSLYIGAVILGVGITLYGAYYVAHPEYQEDVKQTLSNYKNETVESAKRQYEFSKKLFNDFCDYAAEHNGGSTSVYTADGRSYSIDDMQAEGFPSFEKWDELMKKQGEKPGGSIWDKIGFGLDLLGFITDFLEDDSYGYFPPPERPQLYYTGDEAYIDRESGLLNVYWYSDMKFHTTPDSANPQTKILTGENMVKYEGIPDYMSTESHREKFRCAIALFPASVGSNAFQYYTWLQDGTYEQDTWLYAATAYYSFGSSSGNKFTADVKQDTTATYVPGTYWGYNLSSTTTYGDTSTLYFTSSATCEVYCSYSNASSLMLNDFNFVSSNVPVFTTSTALNNYLAWKTNGEDAINYRGPDADPTPTPMPGDKDTSALDIYVNHFGSGSYTAGDVVNINYNIANNWDGSVTNLTYILNGGDDDGGLSDRVVTATPVPKLPDEDGSNTTYNYFISLENAVTNIYNFFVIDTDRISDELSIDFIPAANFEPVIKAFKKLRSSFGEDTYIEVTPSINGVSSESSGTYLDTLYPKISFKCPDILLPYIDTVDEDGTKIIVICDFKDYAEYFVRFRFFIKAVLWIGMLFLLMRELRVNFSV